MIPLNGEVIQTLQRQQMKALPPDSVGPTDGGSMLRRMAVGTYEYRIGVGDVLQLSIPSIVTMNTPQAPSILGEQPLGYVVSADGTIYVPFAGRVAVAGASLQQAQDSVTRALSKYLRNPEVVVTIRDFRSQKVMLAGQVPKPGYMPVADVPLTLLGALGVAGALTDSRGANDPRPLGAGVNTQQGLVPEYGDLERVHVKRGGRDYVVDVQQMLETPELRDDIPLRDGDIVFVPPLERSNVYVLGEVTRPALLEIAAHRSTLADALMAAGGLDQQTAKASQVYVIRGDFAAPTIYQLDGRRPDSLLLAAAFPVQSQDVVYVSTAAVARWNRFLSQLLPSLQGLANSAIIYRTIQDY
jgi:polysaccharide export outer membrane protein